MTLRLRLLALLLTATALPAGAEGVSGPYLAGRAATLAADYPEAAAYAAKALTYDPTNTEVLDGAVISNLGLGQIDSAVALARQAEALPEPPPLAVVVSLADMARAGAWAPLLARLNTAKTLAPLEAGLLRGWALYGAGKPTEALAAFDALAKDANLAPFGHYHKALALAAAGDFGAAESGFSAAEAGPLANLRRGLIAHAQVLSQLERNPDAVALLEKSFGPDPDPVIAALIARLKAGEPVPFDAVTTPAEGLGEAFSSISAALGQQIPGPLALAYARLSLALRPGAGDTLLLAGKLLLTQGQPALAAETLAQIGPDDAARASADLLQAESLIAADKKAEAIALLEALGAQNPKRAEVWMALGDLHRRESGFEAATAAYDKALAALPKDSPVLWVVQYSRAICHERQKRWPEAEADFKAALALAPDQPMLLNYYGYSLIERKERLEEALAMIEKAVALQPDNGAIVDSLGWGLFRLGRITEALAPMERAVELEAVDPVVNDHLGDVYWAVGRKLEARFQWKRALSFKPEEAEAKRIQRKLEIGLDEVLAEEGAPPLPAVQAP